MTKSSEQQLDQDAALEEQDSAVIGAAFKGSLAVFAIVGIVAAVGYAIWKRPEPKPDDNTTVLENVEKRDAPTMELPYVPFTDITASAGINFRHENGAYGQKLLPETMGGGCAFFDYDQDGDQDILFVNSRRWEWDPRSDSGETDERSGLVLYQNDGTGVFTDVTEAMGLNLSIYGMGVAAGDYDQDGRVDLYITCVGPNLLLRNEGDRFVDVTSDAQVAGDSNDWGTSCGWFDYDRDGDLDLLVCNYVDWSKDFDIAQDFQLTGGGRAYGQPQKFGGNFPYLFRNDGEGRFTDVAERAGLQVRNPATNVPMAKSLGIALADFDSDGWIDIVIANDTVQNFYFRNQQDGTFGEQGALVGVAFDMNGKARGAMGIDVARFRNDDCLGVAIGNFANEMTALYVTRSAQTQFVDEAIATGLGPLTRTELTFGLCYFDFDLDGRLDLLCANGHLEEEINRVQSSQHYEQPVQLFWNCGPESDTEFVPMRAEQCGEDLLRPMVGRGASYADIDNDGDLDVLITATGRPARLLRNDQQLNRHWLRLKLRGTRSNLDAIGAWVEATIGDRTLFQQVMPTRSYLSQVELPVTLGLADAVMVDQLKITWPDGSQQVLSDVSADQLLEITQEEAN